MNLVALAFVIVLAAVGGPVRGAEAAAAPPPSRMGQLAFISGGVRMSIEAGSEWLPAELNMPVAARMSLATGLASRLEVRVGSAALWLAPLSQFSLAELDDSHLVLALAHGRAALRLRALPAGESVAIVAEGLRFSASAPGAYRAEFEPRRRRFVVHVLEGQARLQLSGQDLVLNANQWAAADTRTQSLIEQGSGDQRVPLDELAARRDRRGERSAALAWLPAEMTGAEALDGYGGWRNEPGFGPVWYPDGLQPDWAPYRYGHWRWLPPWGWNWVDDAPWGFAPSHYGRWVFLAGRWGWVPGSSAAAARAGRPVYAPALVGFYGRAESASWSPGANAPAVIGWYPLAPGEVYWPAYTAPLDHVRALNAASVVGAGELRAWPESRTAAPAHRFARTSFAATVVPEASFIAMQPVAANQLPMPPAALAQAPLAGGRASPPAGMRAVAPRGGPAAADAWPAQEGGPQAPEGAGPAGGKPSAEERPAPAPARRAIGPRAREPAVKRIRRPGTEAGP